MYIRMSDFLISNDAMAALKSGDVEALRTIYSSSPSTKLEETIGNPLRTMDSWKISFHLQLRLEAQ